MLRKALKVVTELHFRTVSCPGVHLWAKDDVYLSVCVMGQHRRTRGVPAVFPLLLQQKMTFEKIFRFAVDPGDIAVMLEYETVNIELVQLTPPDGDSLAWFEEDSRHFLFPEPKLVPAYSGVGREVLMTRAPHFPGIAPRLEFWTRTTICECSAAAEINIYPNISTRPKASRKPAPRARRQRAASPRRRPATARWGGGGGGATGSGAGARVVFRGPEETPPRPLPQLSVCSPPRGPTPSRPGGSWPGAGGASPAPHRRPALLDRSPAPPRSASADGRMASDAGSLVRTHYQYFPGSSDSDPPVVVPQRGASPSALWRRYRRQQSGSSSSRSRWTGPADSWEEVQERVRRLLTTPKAVRRLLYGSTVSEVEEVLSRRSISPGLP